MNDIERRKVKENIIATIDKIGNDIKNLVRLTRPIAPDNALGRITRMEAINAKGVNEAALAAARMKLARLQGALTRIDNPEFGVCFECGDDIPLARIMLLPETVHCVDCAE